MLSSTCQSSKKTIAAFSRVSLTLPRASKRTSIKRFRGTKSRA
ncbi:MAG: hypothetical protein WKF71_11620 [Pyrinomonadaceae bacterium]